MTKTLWKNVNFSSIWTSCFFSLERRLFVLEYHKRDCPGLYFPEKKKVGKMARFGPKLLVNPFGKCQFFEFLDFFYSLEWRFFGQFRRISCKSKRQRSHIGRAGFILNDTIRSGKKNATSREQRLLIGNGGKKLQVPAFLASKNKKS